MAIPSFPEYSGLELEFYPTDVNGTPATPDNARWRLLCQTTDEVVQDWVDLTPGTTIPVFVSGLLIEMRNRSTSRELWCVELEANYGQARGFSDTADFYVKRRTAVN